VELEVIRWTDAAPAAERELRARLAREGFSVFRWSDAPGAHYAPHHHDHDESIWIVAGAITFTIAGRALGLAAGDRLMLPAGTVHVADAGPAGATYLIGERDV
jgi:quercetin dioxygenase-like cupin family protein